MLWGDGSPTREFLYVDDCVDAFVLATERYDGAEPVNLGTGEEIAVRDLAALIARATGFERLDRVGHVQAERLPEAQARHSRADELFGFRASTPLREGIEIKPSPGTETRCQ